jgi:hypothetical protein
MRTALPTAALHSDCCAQPCMHPWHAVRTCRPWKLLYAAAFSRSSPHTCEGMAPNRGRVGAWASFDRAKSEGLGVAKAQLLRLTSGALRVMPIAAVAAADAACIQLRAQSGKAELLSCRL